MNVELEPIVGRYFTTEIAGERCRVYFEEAGAGIPLVCLHTAGADARQFRHLMCDPAVTDHFRCDQREPIVVHDDDLVATLHQFDAANGRRVVRHDSAAVDDTAVDVADPHALHRRNRA